MDKVVHFEVPVDDWDRAKKFYKDNFGWDEVEMKMPHGEMVYVLVQTAPTDKDGMVQEKGAINGGLFKRSERASSPSFYIQVDSIDEKVKQIEASGGSVVGTKGPIPNGSFIRVKDSEGNVIGLIDSSKTEMPAM